MSNSMTSLSKFVKGDRRAKKEKNMVDLEKKFFLALSIVPTFLNFNFDSKVYFLYISISKLKKERKRK